MKYFIIFLLMLAHGIGIAQDGCNIFPKTKKAYRAKSPFLSNIFLEASVDVLTGYDKSVDGFTNVYLIPFHLGVAQKIKRRVVLHLALGGGVIAEEGRRGRNSIGSGKIGIDYFFKNSMEGFGIGVYGHGIDFFDGGVSIPMLHLMYAKSSKKLFNQYHLSAYPFAEGVVLGFGVSVGYKAY